MHRAHLLVLVLAAAIGCSGDAYSQLITARATPWEYKKFLVCYPLDSQSDRDDPVAFVNKYGA